MNVDGFPLLNVVPAMDLEGPPAHRKISGHYPVANIARFTIPESTHFHRNSRIQSSCRPTDLSKDHDSGYENPIDRPTTPSNALLSNRTCTTMLPKYPNYRILDVTYHYRHVLKLAGMNASILVAMKGGSSGKVRTIPIEYDFRNIPRTVPT